MTTNYPVRGTMRGLMRRHVALLLLRIGQLLPLQWRRHPIPQRIAVWLRGMRLDAGRAACGVEFTEEQERELKRRIAVLDEVAGIHVILIANSDGKWIRRSLKSLCRTRYPGLHIAVLFTESSARVAASAVQEVRPVALECVQLADDSHASRSLAINHVVDISGSEFTLIIRAGDIVSPALFATLAETVAAVPSADLIYTDELIVDHKGTTRKTLYKPAWSPEFALSQPYTGAATFYRTKLVQQVGGVRISAGNAQEWDLLLRVSERARTVVHKPEVLFFRLDRDPLSKEPPALRQEAAMDVAYQALRRRGMDGSVRPGRTSEVVSLCPRPTKSDRVSIIISTRDRHELLKTCIDSILEKTDYSNFEIVVVDNDSQESATHELLDQYTSNGAVRVVRVPGPFNYSTINNIGARTCYSKFLLLLNNDVEVISPQWLNVLVSWGEQREVGAVGARLYFPNDTLQHSGVVLRGEGSGSKPAFHAHKTFAAGDPGYMSRLHSTCNYSTVTGACLLVRASDFEAVGGLDERLSVAYNDIDLCLKLRSCGFRVVWTPECELFHHESASRKTDEARNQRWKSEQIWMHEKWGQALCADPYYNPNLTLERSDFSVAGDDEKSRIRDIRVIHREKLDKETKLSSFAG